MINNLFKNFRQKYSIRLKPISAIWKIISAIWRKLSERSFFSTETAPFASGIFPKREKKRKMLFEGHGVSQSFFLCPLWKPFAPFVVKFPSFGGGRGWFQPQRRKDFTQGINVLCLTVLCLKVSNLTSHISHRTQLLKFPYLCTAKF